MVAVGTRITPRHRVTGGGRPPPVPTERGVQISRTTLFGGAAGPSAASSARTFSGHGTFDQRQLIWRKIVTTTARVPKRLQVALHYGRLAVSSHRRSPHQSGGRVCVRPTRSPAN